MESAKKQTNFVTLMLVMASLFMTSMAKAAELKVSGAGASDAVVTYMDGTNVTGQELNKYAYYEVSYQWALPAKSTVKAGDTATFTLLDNVEIRVADTKFDVTNEQGKVVGSFEIKKGARTGVLTFNDFFGKNKMKDIRGALALRVSGTKDNTASDWFLNKAGWLNSDNKPNWTVVYNPQSKALTNVQIMDTLRGGQTYDVDSIQLWYGHVENNQFIADEKVADPVKNSLIHVSPNQDIISIDFDKLDKAVQLVYQTNANTNAEIYTLTNIVDATSDQLGMATMTSTIEVGGAGIADGRKGNKPCTPSTCPEYPHCRPTRPHCPHHRHHHAHCFFNGIEVK